MTEIESSESPPGKGRSRTARAYRLLALVVVVRPFGNLCLAWGTKHFSQVLSLNPFVYLEALFNPFVALGIGMLVLGLLMRMALFSLADLSFVLPLSASGYVITTFLGKIVLREHVSLAAWLGTLLIFAGTAVVGSTARKTNSQHHTAE